MVHQIVNDALDARAATGAMRIGRINENSVWKLPSRAQARTLAPRIAVTIGTFAPPGGGCSFEVAGARPKLARHVASFLQALASGQATATPTKNLNCFAQPALIAIFNRGDAHQICHAGWMASEEIEQKIGDENTR